MIHITQKQPIWLTLIVSLSFFAGAQVIAAEDVRFTPGKGELELKSSATATWMRFIEVYQAALYAPHEIQAEEINTSLVPLSLELTYLTGVSKDNIIKAAEVALQRQHDTATLDKFAEQITALHQSYRDTAKGDKYRLDFDPASGVSLYFNDSLLVAFGDVSFGRLYVGIWLDEPPLSQPLRTALLDW